MAGLQAHSRLGASMHVTSRRLGAPFHASRVPPTARTAGQAGDIGGERRPTKSGVVLAGILSCRFFCVCGVCVPVLGVNEAAAQSGGGQAPALVATGAAPSRAVDPCPAAKNYVVGAQVWSVEWGAGCTSRRSMPPSHALPCRPSARLSLSKPPRYPSRSFVDGVPVISNTQHPPPVPQLLSSRPPDLLIERRGKRKRTVRALPLRVIDYPALAASCPTHQQLPRHLINSSIDPQARVWNLVSGIPSSRFFPSYIPANPNPQPPPPTSSDFWNETRNRPTDNRRNQLRLSNPPDHSAPGRARSSPSDFAPSSFQSEPSLPTKTAHHARCH